MSNENGMNRRTFLGSVAAAGSTAVAGCGSSQDTQTNSSDEEVDEEEFLRYVKSTALDIQGSLTRTHESPSDIEMVELLGSEDHYTLRVNEDLGELIRGSTQQHENADLYMASEFGVADEVLNDARPELGVTAEVLDTELGKLEEEVEVPDNYDFHVQIDIHGRGDANVGPNWEFGSSNTEDELEELYQDAARSGKREGFNSLTNEYIDDEFSTLSEGEAQTVSIDRTEHTLEYIETINEGRTSQAGVFRINGEVTMVEDYDTFSIGGQEYEVESNPVYVQDREDVEDGVLFREV